jgi:hypothetical protein
MTAREATQKKRAVGDIANSSSGMFVGEEIKREAQTQRRNTMRPTRAPRALHACRNEATGDGQRGEFCANDEAEQRAEAHRGRGSHDAQPTHDGLKSSVEMRGPPDASDFGA